MTAFTPSYGQRKPVRQTLTTTSDVTLYTGQAKIRAFLSSIYFSNGSSSDNVYLWINDGTSDFYILQNNQISANNYLHLTGLEIDIREGDTLKAKLQSSGDLDIIATIIEQYPSDRVSLSEVGIG